MPNQTAPTHPPPGFQLAETLWEHRRKIFWMRWSPDGQTLASASLDGTVRFWDARTLETRHIVTGHASAEGGLAWSPDGSRLAVVRGDGVRVWDLSAGEPRQVFYRDRRGARTEAVLAWSPDGGRLAALSPDRLEVLDSGNGEVIRGVENPVPALGMQQAEWAPDGSSIAVKVGSTIYYVSPSDMTAGGATFHAAPINSFRWLPGSDTLALGCDDQTVRICKGGVTSHATAHELKVLEGHTGAVTSLDCSPDGTILFSAQEGLVQLWRCADWSQLTSLRCTPAGPQLVAFNPQVPLLATLGYEGRAICVWGLNLPAVFANSAHTVHYTTTKIALVGDSGVGKTGLGWRITHGDFKEHSSTHGQQFWVVDELGTTRADGTECEAVLWDLAGQPDYRLIHALFLDDVDLALVLFDPTNRTEPLKGVEYWLKHLSRERSDGRKRRVILVGARADRGAPTLTRQELEEFCRQHNVDGGYVATSAMTDEGLPELLARVKEAIAWNDMPATVTTQTFKRVKEFVLALKEDGGRGGVLVGAGDLRARLEEADRDWAFTDAEMMTAVRHLSNHGYVAVLRSSSGEETILLAPDLLANLAASFVLEARRNSFGLGALDEARVLAGGYEFPELAGLDEHERDVLLDAAAALFLEHNLCFRETLGTQTLLIFPALINQKRPQLEETETVDDFSYRATGAVENVYAALVVQLGYTRNFTRTNQWQNQAEYETARGDVCGFRQVDEREGEVELVLYYAKEKPGAQLLFQGLFEEFLRGRDVTVTKFPPLPCPKCDYRQPRSEVVKRISEGKGFLFCGDCGKKIMLPKEGEKVTPAHIEPEQLSEEQARAQRRTAFESALVRVKAVARDERKKAPSCFVSYAWGDEAQERWVRRLAKDLENAGVDVILDQKDNQQLGANVARFAARIEQSDFVVAVGTPLYRLKYENKVSDAGSIVAAEADLINLRLTGTEEEKATVLPLLLEGSDKTSFPPFLRGRVYGRYADEETYVPALFDLILTLYRIRFDHPAVSDLRNKLRGGGGRQR